MSIKVTLGKVKPHVEKPFPKLMVINNERSGSQNGTVVLFSEPQKGVVISGRGIYEDKIGYYSTTWIEQNFSDYNDPITLQNT